MHLKCAAPRTQKTQRIRKSKSGLPHYGLGAVPSIGTLGAILNETSVLNHSGKTKVGGVNWKLGGKISLKRGENRPSKRGTSRVQPNSVRFSNGFHLEQSFLFFFTKIKKTTGLLESTGIHHGNTFSRHLSSTQCKYLQHPMNKKNLFILYLGCCVQVCPKATSPVLE